MNVAIPPGPRVGKGATVDGQRAEGGKTHRKESSEPSDFHVALTQELEAATPGSATAGVATFPGTATTTSPTASFATSKVVAGDGDAAVADVEPQLAKTPKAGHKHAAAPDRVLNGKLLSVPASAFARLDSRIPLRSAAHENKLTSPNRPAPAAPQIAEIHAEGKPAPVAVGPSPLPRIPTVVQTAAPELSPAVPVAAVAAARLAPMLSPAAIEDPSLRISLLGRAAHISIDAGKLGAVDLHVRVRDGVADVRLVGEAASLVSRRSHELSMVLKTEGLSLGNLDLSQRQDQEGRPDSEASDTAPVPVPTASAVQSIGSPLDTSTTDRIHVKA